MTFKPIYLHLIYVSIIAILGFQYWSKSNLLDAACQSLGGIDKQLSDNREIIMNRNMSLMDLIEKQAQILPMRYTFYSDKAKTVTKNIKSIDSLLKEYKSQFIDLCGGWDTTQNILKVANKSTQTVTFFNENRIKQLKSYLSDASIVLLDVNEYYRKEIKKRYFIIKLLNDDKYWKSIPLLPHFSAYTELSRLKNLILSDETTYLNLILDTVGPDKVEIKFDKYRIGIAPKKAALIEGEIFESDIYITQYVSLLPETVSFSVNGMNLKINEGVGHYISLPQSVGKHTIKAAISIKNPETGEVSNSMGEFEYEVLPKCSRDCQSLPKSETRNPK